jgi:ThiC-associated domain
VVDASPDPSFWTVRFGHDRDRDREISRTFETIVMIAKPQDFEAHSSKPLPNSTRVYVAGQLHTDVRVPMREIALSSTRRRDGTEEANAPVRVYDTSGPWGDPEFRGTVEEGLPPLRRDWIRRRGRPGGERA